MKTIGLDRHHAVGENMALYRTSERVLQGCNGEAAPENQSLGCLIFRYLDQHVCRQLLQKRFYRLWPYSTAKTAEDNPHQLLLSSIQRQSSDTSNGNTPHLPVIDDDTEVRAPAPSPFTPSQVAHQQYSIT